MQKEIIELIASVLELDKKDINENTNLLVDLEIESLDLVDLISAFEEKYQLEIPDQDIKNFQTVGDIIKYIEQNINDFNTYKHTFKLNENNNYYWYSTELSN